MVCLALMEPLITVRGVQGPANDRGALYRKDLETGEVIRVDTLSDGTKMRNKWSINEATMTSDGRFAIFETPDVQLQV